MSDIEQARRDDRRVARTKATLRSAFVSLLSRRPYERITIKQICEQANVGRSTFYAHFRSKDDLKRSGIEHLRQVLAGHQGKAVSGEPAASGAFSFSRAMFEHGRQYLDHYLALRGGRGGAIALARIREILLDLVREEPMLRDHPDATAREIGAHFVVGAFMAVLTWWLDRGAGLPPEEVDAVFRRFASQGLCAPLPHRGASRP